MRTGARDVIDRFGRQCQPVASATHAEPSPTPPPGAVNEWLERVRPSDFRPISDEA
jgi:hypothetical protein